MEAGDRDVTRSVPHHARADRLRWTGLHQCVSKTAAPSPVRDCQEMLLRCQLLIVAEYDSMSPGLMFRRPRYHRESVAGQLPYFLLVSNDSCNHETVSGPDLLEATCTS